MNFYLYNTIDPGCTGLPKNFTVTSEAVMLVATGLLPGQSIPIEVKLTAACDPNCPVPTSHWGPLVREGCPMAISANATQYIELIPGEYRINTSALPATQPVAIGRVDASELGNVRPQFFMSTGGYCPSAPGGGGGPTGTFPSFDPEVTPLCFVDTAGEQVGFAYSEITYNSVTGVIASTRLIDPITGGVYVPPAGSIPSSCGGSSTASLPPCPPGTAQGVLNTWG